MDDGRKELQYDVFISYSLEDFDWVKEVLIRRFEKNDIKYCIDKQDFEAGKPIIGNIEQAIQSSRKTLLVLTPNYYNSDWTKFESLLTLTKDPLNNGGRIIPILAKKIDNMERIDYLNMFSYIDFTSPSDNEFQVGRLIGTIRSSHTDPVIDDVVHKSPGEEGRSYIQECWIEYLTQLKESVPEDQIFGFNILKSFLIRNLDDEKKYPGQETIKIEQERILEQLDKLSLKLLNRSFREVAGEEENHFFSGAVLHGKVYGYSNLGGDIQNEAKNLIKTILSSFLSVHKWAKLDFKGGDFLLFIERQKHEEILRTSLKAFLLGFVLKLKAKDSAFDIGITVHWEQEAETCTIGDSRQFLGPSINEAKLITSFSNKGHFFVSDAVFNSIKDQLNKSKDKKIREFLVDLRKLYKRRNNKWLDSLHLNETYQDYTFGFDFRKFKYYDCYRRSHELLNFYIANEELFIGVSSPPNDRIEYEYRDKKEDYPLPVFIERLIEADEVCLIGITHECTKIFLERALKLRGNKFWKKLQIVFPSKTVVENIVDKRSSEARVNRWRGGRRDVFMFLMGTAKDSRDCWECLEYKGNLSFIGAKFIGSNHSFVRIAPILPGTDSREVFYSEVFHGMRAYDQVSRAFDMVYNLSSPINRWNIYGEVTEDTFIYKGLVKRKHLEGLVDRNKGKKFCFPVILVVLYTDAEAGMKAILQHRTVFNSEGDIGKYSNISGRIIELDIIKSRGKKPSSDYFEKIYSRKNGEVLEDDVREALEQEIELKKGERLPDEVWRQAAAREIKEGLGIADVNEKLELKKSYCLDRNEFDLFFHIFVLGLKRKELQKINKLRPHANLKKYTLSDLKQFHKENNFNHLLQKKFNEIFIPIYSELNIVE